jgi:simple sugar transport system permease protein
LRWQLGRLGGLVNGILISRLGIPSILATLAAQMVYRGIAIGITQGSAVTGIPALYSEIGHVNLFGFLPMPLFVFLIVLLIFAFLLRYTTYGEKLYMIGSNPKAARSAPSTRRNAHRNLCDLRRLRGHRSAADGIHVQFGQGGLRFLLSDALHPDSVPAGVLPDGGIGKIFNALIAIVTIQIIATCVNMFPEINSITAA